MMADKIREPRGSWIIATVPIVSYGLLSVVASPLGPVGGLILCFAGAVLLKHRYATLLCTCLVLICGLNYGTVLGNFWPTPSVVAALLTAGLSAAVGSMEWLHLQALKVKPLCISIVIGALAAMSVVLWMHFSEVTPAQILFQLPQNLSPLELAGMILCFAFFNSFAEEFIFRGLALQALASKSSWSANIIQAVAFGLLHFKGLPFGFSGSLMAMVFALFMGGLRQKTKSFIYPWVSHFTANVGMAMGLYYFTAAMQ